MTRDPMTIRTDDPLDAALEKMRTHGVRRLPVVGAGGRLEGLVAFDDILEVMSEELNDLVGLVAREQRRERELRRA
jgi:CBS domain-containing protein